MKKTFILRPYPHPSRELAIEAIKSAPDGFAVTVGEPTRNLDQNSAQWPLLEAFSKQLEWPVNGSMCKLSADEWKDILTAAFRKESPRLAQGLDGGVVMLGQRTSKFSKREFSDWLEFLHAVAVSREVKL